MVMKRYTPVLTDLPHEGNEALVNQNDLVPLNGFFCPLIRSVLGYVNVGHRGNAIGIGLFRLCLHFLLLFLVLGFPFPFRLPLPLRPLFDLNPPEEKRPDFSSL